jgi:hypothetical protein
MDFQSVFTAKLVIFGKVVGKHLCIFSENLIFLTHKNSYIGSLCITDPEYGGHSQEIRSFSQFLLQTGDFR